MSVDLATSFSRVLNDLSQSFHVPDIIPKNADCIFILESPHIQELKYGAPVSGPSGATMSKHIFGEAYGHLPLGRLVKKNEDEQKHRPRLDRIGLMNVCNIPMQRAAYSDRSVRENYASWLQAMEQVRTMNQKDDLRDELLASVQSVLVRHLRDKLLALRERPLVLAPCGRFAQKFHRLAAVTSPDWRVIQGVPHPSYNSWDRSQYRGVVQEVVSLFA